MDLRVPLPTKTEFSQVGLSDWTRFVPATQFQLGPSPSLPRLITGSPLLRKRRNAGRATPHTPRCWTFPDRLAGAKPPEWPLEEKHHTITVTSTTTASTSTSQSGDETDPVPDSVRGTKLGDERLAYFPAVGPRTLPHPPKRSNEKVSPCWHSRDDPGWSLS